MTHRAPNIPAWVDRLAARFRETWRPAKLDEVNAARLLERQLARARQPKWMTDLAMLVMAALTVWMGHPAVDTRLGIVWVAVLAFNPLSKFWLPRWARHFGRSHRITPRVLCLQAFVTGLLFIVVSAWVFLRTDTDTRMLLGIFAAGVLLAETFSYARVPPAGVVWLGTMVSVALVTFLQLDHRVGIPGAMALLLYSAVILRDLLTNSREFVDRCLAEFEAERQTHMVELLLSEFEGASRDWFWESDAEARLTHASPRLADTLATDEPALIGRPLLTALSDKVGMSEPEGRRAVELLQTHLASHRPFRDILLPLRTPTGKQWWSISGKPLCSRDGHLTGWRGIGLDVTAAQCHRLELERLAVTDSLTGLGNRHAFTQALENCYTTASAIHPVSLLLLDLDAFKAVNDAHGHDVGDRLLQAVARRLETLPMAGSRLILARLGGDEFAILQSDTTLPPRAEQLASRILEHLHVPFVIGDLRIDVRCSVGIAYAPTHANSAADLLRAADVALYAAKSHGRDTWQVFDDALGARVAHRLQRTRELAGAIVDGALEMHYQPVFEASGASPVAAEALLRWRHPSLGLLPPSAFLDLAEESGLIVPLGMWALRQACHDAARWRLPLRVSVNLSVRQFSDHALVDSVRQILTDSGLPAHRLELEITESTLADQPAAGRELGALRGLGVELALDDFGTGFSSLAYLQQFGFDRLKIDRAFVQPLRHAHGQSRALVQAIIALARALHLECTAEGIEDSYQLKVLREMGCNAFQGYLLGRPVSTADLDGLLADAVT